MLSNAAIQELRGELEALKEQGRRLGQEIAAIEKLLKMQEFSGVSPRTARLSTKVSSSPNGGGGTFASQIRDALASFGRKARPRDVVEELKRRGVTSDGSTPLNLRVNSELYRMARRKTGGVAKTGRGFYRVEQKTRSHK